MTQRKSVPSPCVNICELNNQDLCVACFRTGREISDWGAMSDEQKRAVWQKIREREAQAVTPLR